MSDLCYDIVRGMCYPVYWSTSHAVILHKERADRRGAYILASNHCSPYDIPALIGASPRRLDFLSIVEMQSNPMVARLYQGMNCEFVDRSRRDPTAVRALVERLRRGRVVAMFPEGGIKAGEESAVHGGRIRPGCVHLAQLSGAPIVPCVLMGTGSYWKPMSWLPLKRTWFGVNYGKPIRVGAGADAATARQQATVRLQAAYRALYEELKAAMGPAAT